MRVEQTHLLPPAQAELPREALLPRGREGFAVPSREEADSVKLSGNTLKQIVNAMRSGLAIDLPSHPGIPDEGLEPAEISVPAPMQSSASNPVETNAPKPVSAPAALAVPAPDAQAQTASEGLSTKQNLTEEEQREVEKLKNRDREVRAHEQAHLTAAGQYATGGPTYEYQRGPNNRQYATGGEVQIDTSEIAGDPQATIRKAQIVRQAAQAPAEPSSQDRRVAVAAARMESSARQELSKEQREEAQGGNAASSGQSTGSERVNSAEAPAVGAETDTTSSKHGESAATIPQAGAPNSSGQYANDSIGNGDLLDMIV